MTRLIWTLYVALSGAIKVELSRNLQAYTPTKYDRQENGVSNPNG